MVTWLDAAGKYAKAAEQARLEGDATASLALAIEGAKCLQIARNLAEADKLLRNTPDPYERPK